MNVVIDLNLVAEINCVLGGNDEIIYSQGIVLIILEFAGKKEQIGALMLSTEGYRRKIDLRNVYLDVVIGNDSDMTSNKEDERRRQGSPK